VVHHLPNLVNFDGMDVTSESRKLIMATIIKKRMYYNMRIITIKRNTQSLLKTLKPEVSQQFEVIENDSRKASSLTKAISKHLDILANEVPKRVKSV
jgi:hypothetical protein